MLFSPPKQFGKHFFYKIIVFSGIMHGLFLGAYFIGESWLCCIRPLTVSLKKVAGQVQLFTTAQSSLSSKITHQVSSSKRVQNSQKRHPIRGASQKRATRTRQPQRMAQKKAPIPKKKGASPLKKSVAQKALRPIEKKSVEKKAPCRQNNELRHSKRGPQQRITSKAALSKQSPKIQETKAVIPKRADASQVRGSSGGQIGHAPSQHKKFMVTEGTLSSDAVVREFAQHFVIPPGFDEHEPFTVAFDIEDFSVVNVSCRGKESLVVYTAVKDALLKSRMPHRNAKNITMVII